MSYYLQTLEGAPRYLGEVPQERRDMVRRAFDVYWQMTTNVNDLTERFYKVFDFLTRVYTDEEIFTLVDRPDVHPAAAEAWRLFSINQGRKAAAAQAAQSASEAEAARIAALQQQQAQEEAEAEREARDAQRREDEIRRAQEEADAQATALEQAEAIINEGNSMAQNIPAREETDVNISTQLVTSGQEYTVVDETSETIAYVDEAGELHVEQKQKSGLGWLVAAAAAFFLLT